MDELDGMVETSLEEIDEIGEEIEEEKKPTRKRWETLVAISVSILAVLSTFAALLAAFSADDVLNDRIHEIIEWSQYQTDRLEYEVLTTRHTVLNALDKPVDIQEVAKREEYLADLEKYQASIEKMELEAAGLVYEHHVLAIAITIFQAVIAMSSVAVVIRRKAVWLVGLSLAGVGMIFAIWGAVLFFG